MYEEVKIYGQSSDDDFDADRTHYFGIAVVSWTWHRFNDVLQMVFQVWRNAHIQDRKDERAGSRE